VNRRAPRRHFWKTLPGVLTALATLVTAIGGLLGGLAAAGLIGGRDDGEPGSRPAVSGPASANVEAAGSPIVVRLEYRNGGYMRGFFTPKGSIAAPGGKFYANPVKEVATAVWTAEGIEQRARVSLVTSETSPPVALFRLVGRSGPRANFPIRSAFTLQPGDPVKTFVGPGDTSPGRVIAITHAANRWDDRLVTTPLSFQGDAGAPVLDRAGSVVAMIFIHQLRSRDTEAVPIEAIRARFPEAF
jgi:hypothetical protein